MFTLAISYLTKFNLPRFMDLTFQVLVDYGSLQNRVLLSPPDTSPTGRCFHFDSASSFLLELFLHSSLVTYWAPPYMGSSSFSVISFCLFILFTWLAPYSNIWSSLLAQMVKNLPAVQESQFRSLDWEDPLEKGMATCSSIIAWRIPWAEEPGGLQSMGSWGVGHH